MWCGKIYLRTLVHYAINIESVKLKQALALQFFEVPVMKKEEEKERERGQGECKKFWNALQTMAYFQYFHLSNQYFN